MATTFFSCQNDNIAPATVSNSTITRTNSTSANYIPYADSLDLAQFKSDKQVINYELSRKLALLELDATKFREQFGWDGYDVSEKPVLIYGFDSRPKYYEFVVLDAEGKPSGTVKTYAKKVSDGVLSEVSDGVRDYMPLVSKGAGGMKFFDGPNGHLLVGMPSKSGNQPTTLVDSQTGEAVASGKELTDEDKLQMLTESIKGEQQQRAKVLDTLTNVALKQQLAVADTIKTKDPIVGLKTTMDEAHKKRDDYWTEVAKFDEKLLTTPDQDIVNKSTKFGWFTSFFTRLFSPTVETRTIARYKQKSDHIRNNIYTDAYLRNYHFLSGTKWCGPAAMDFIYYTGYGSYRYNHFESYASTFGGFGLFWGINQYNSTKPMSPFEMCVSMGIATGWRTYVEPVLSVGLDNAHDHIKYHNDPIIILTVVRTKRGNELHWMVGWESKREKNWYFWDKHWFRINDNGAVGGDFRTTQHRAGWPFAFLKVYE